MCWEAAIPLAIGVGTSALGSALTNQSTQASAQNTANQRNAVLANTLNRNNALSTDATGNLTTRMGEIAPAAIQQQQGALASNRNSAITSNLPQITPTNMPGAADGSTLVKTAIAKALAEAADKSSAAAAAQSQLGSYGDLFLDQGLQDANAGRYIDTDTNAAKQNIALLPEEQDLAANENAEPVSPLGAILTGLGNTVAAGAGSGKVTNTGFH